MKLQNEGEEEYSNISVRMPTIILAASIAIFVILALVLVANNSGKKKHAHTGQANTAAVEEESNASDMQDNLTADDLNFWDMYSTDNTVVEDDTAPSDPASRKDQLEQRAEEMRKAEEEAAKAAEEEAKSKADPATDGKHTMVKHIDGSTEWIPINSSIKLNNYEDTGFQSQNGILGYYTGGRRSTRVGADISQYTTSVDWPQLATEVDYVMIRVGARGYDSGKIIADTKFSENVLGAVKAGIPFGVYFSSQAVNEEEARAEAAYVLTQLAVAQSNIEKLDQLTSGTQSGTDGTNNGNTTSGSGTQTNTANGTSSSDQNTNASSTTTNPGLKQILEKYGLITDPAKLNTTTKATDADGNITTTVIDNLGNVSIEVTDKDGNVTEKKTVNLDPYGYVTTVITDAQNSEKITTDLISGYDAAQRYAILGLPVPTQLTGTGTTEGAGTAADQVQNVVTVSNNADMSHRFPLTYPVAVEMHLISNDISRIEQVDKTTRTSILNRFCETIESGGYEAMIGANKEFLLCQLNTAGLSKYDIWLSNEGNLPDYPYTMSMWKYNTGGKLLKSLSGDYGVDVGFIDYTIR